MRRLLLIALLLLLLAAPAVFAQPFIPAHPALSALDTCSDCANNCQSQASQVFAACIHACPTCYETCHQGWKATACNCMGIPPCSNDACILYRQALCSVQ